ncbi:MAG: hypothetical protein WD772_09790 [Pseudohongiellaceae bacterium]
MSKTGFTMPSHDYIGSPLEGSSLMSKSASPSLLVILILLCSPVRIFAQDNETIRQLENLGSYQLQLQEMETRLGRFDHALIEPLTGIAETSMALNQFDETRLALDRAIQITRMSEGLYTDTQFPLLTMMVENDARRGNWVDANKMLEHLYWLYTNKHRDIDDSVISELMRLSDFHLEAVAADSPDQQAYHFRHAANISWLALRAAKLLWGENDPRLAPLQYNLAKQYYLQAVAVDKGNRTGYELREVVPGSSWVRSRQTVKQGFYLTGLRLLRDLRANYTESNWPDPEAAAIANLYIADWQLLFTQDSAESAYKQAYSELLFSGVEQPALNSFFATPIVLPEQDYYSSIGDALVVRQSASVQPAELQVQNLVRFNAWAPAFPDVEFPLGRANIRFNDQQDWGFAMLSFNLGALEKVSRWVDGRYITRISVPDAIEILDQVPQASLELKGLADKVHSMHFRPRLINGEAEPVSGTLQYLIPNI